MHANQSSWGSLLIALAVVFTSGRNHVCVADKIRGPSKSSNMLLDYRYVAYKIFTFHWLSIRNKATRPIMRSPAAPYLIPIRFSFSPWQIGFPGNPAKQQNRFEISSFIYYCKQLRKKAKSIFLDACIDCVIFWYLD